MNGADKQIKFTFAVDQRSIEVTKAAIRQLTSEVKTLVETMGRAGQGLGGGAGILGGLTGVRGGINAQQQGGLKSGSGLTSAIAADAKALAGVARASTDALRQMTSATSTAFSRQTADARQFAQALDPIAAKLRQIAGAGGWAPGSSGPRPMAMPLSPGTNANSAWLAGGIPGQTPGAAFQNYLNLGLKQSSSTMPGGALGQMMQPMGGGMMGSMGGMFGGMMGQIGRFLPFASAAGAVPYLTQQVMNREQFMANETMASPMDAIRRRAGISQNYGNLGVSIRNDPNMALAARQTFTPTGLHGIFSNETRTAMIRQAQINAGDTPGAGDMANKMSQAIGRVVDSNDSRTLMALASGDKVVLRQALTDAMGGMNANASPEWQAKLTRMTDDIAMDMSKRAVDTVNLNRDSMNVQQSGWRSQFMGEYTSRMALMNMARSRNAPMRGVGRSPFSPEELVGMSAQLGQLAGGRFMGDAESILSLQAGGLAGAAGIYGGASGYGDPNAFMRTIRQGSSMYGRAGLVDVAASGNVAGAYTQGMMGGDMFTSGEEGMGGMLAATGMMGGGVRAGRAAVAGFGSLGGMMGGQTDRLQEGINVLASVSAAGGGLYAQEALRNMSPAQRMDIMRRIGNGTLTDQNMPLELKLQGVTVESLKAYGSAQDKLMFARFMPGQATDAVGSAVAAFKTSGFSSVKSFDDLTKLGVAAVQSGLAPTVDAGRAMMAERMGMEAPELLKSLKGGSVGAAAYGSLEHQVKVNQDDNVRRYNEYVTGPDGKKTLIQGTDSTSKNLGQGLVAISQDLTIGAAQITSALELLSKDIRAAGLAIREGREFRPKAVAPTAKK